jgi:hydrogenase maturation protease
VHLLRDAFPHARGPAKLKVVGIGNAWRSDDAVGLVVARDLREVLPESVAVLEREGEPTGLIETWADAQALWIVDAVSSGARPGTVHRVDASHSELPDQFRGGSTHHLSLREAVAMARALGRLPKHVVVFGVEGGNFEVGEQLTPQVAAAVPIVVAAVRGEVQRSSEC